MQSPLLPGEIRKAINLCDPELQNVYMPVFDEMSRQDYIDTQELKSALFEAKYKWYVDRVYKQFKPTTKSLFEEN